MSIIFPPKPRFKHILIIDLYIVKFLSLVTYLRNDKTYLTCALHSGFWFPWLKPQSWTTGPHEYDRGYYLDAVLSPYKQEGPRVDHIMGVVFGDFRR